MWRLGILGNVPITDAEGARLWGALIQGLAELGYVEGQNVSVPPSLRLRADQVIE